MSLRFRFKLGSVVASLCCTAVIGTTLSMAEQTPLDRCRHAWRDDRLTLRMFCGHSAPLPAGTRSARYREFISDLQGQTGLSVAPDYRSMQKTIYALRARLSADDARRLAIILGQAYLPPQIVELNPSLADWSSRWLITGMIYDSGPLDLDTILRIVHDARQRRYTGFSGTDDARRKFLTDFATNDPHYKSGRSYYADLAGALLRNDPAAAYAVVQSVPKGLLQSFKR